MRPPHNLFHDLALMTVVLAFVFLVQNATAQTPVPCATPPAQPEGKLATWKQGATVNVMIDPTFSPTQQQAIKDQFEKWKNAGGANVTFKFVDPIRRVVGQQRVGHQSFRLSVKCRKKGLQRRATQTDLRSMVVAAILP